MVASSPLFSGLVDDTAMFAPVSATASRAVAAHQECRQAWYHGLIGPLVVPDQRLAEVGRAVLAGERPAESAELAVSVVNTAGAGGLVSLAGRQVKGVRIVSVETALRDLDDLMANAARVVAAAAVLADAGLAEAGVFVELPFAPGWERAVTEVEAGGLNAKLRAAGPHGEGFPDAGQLARQLAVLIEADLPFTVTDLPFPAATAGAGLEHPREEGFLSLLLAVEALVEGASEHEAAQILGRTDGSPAETVSGWSDAEATRVRRRLLSVGCGRPQDLVRDLTELGLIEGGLSEAAGTTTRIGR
jgi:hypothetical protein